LFTEQPAPPQQPVAEVQTHQAAVAFQAPPQAPTPSRVAAPEAIPAPAAAIAAPPPAETANPTPTQPAKTAAPTSVPATPTISESNSDTATAHEAAKAQRRKEVEQALIEITAKARAQQKQQQEQQAAVEAAKYAESGDFDAAKKVVSNPALAAKARADLLKKLQAKQAKKNQLAGKKANPKSSNGVQVTAKSGKPSGAIAAPEYLGNPSSGYSAAPIMPMTQAELKLRLGKLIGRHLDFTFPLSVPAPITSMFGWRIHPISGNPRFHRGIDFGAPLGTPIVAAKAGRVEVADFMDGYGLTVILRHPTTQQTLYGHMSQVFVKPGEVVKKGQLLGLVGSTGNSTGPHLHFEVHEMTSEGWVALDPALALNPAIALAQAPQSATTLSSKPQTFNLSLSGLLDINAPSEPLPFTTPFGETLVSGLLPPSTPQDTFVPASLLLPFAMLPSAIPEVRWLISPFVDSLLAEEPLIPLVGLSQPAQTVTFSPFPALSTIPEPVAFNPASSVPSAPTAVRLANTKPFAGLTIAEQTPGAVRLEALQKRPAFPTLQASRNASR